jgi:OmpA-OmpF porin, OOP family
MRCNWRRWLWGLIPLMIVSWVAAHAERGRIEQDLSSRAKLALQASGLGWAATAFNGRDAAVIGKAVDESEPGKAIDVLRTVWGVRQVDNRADLLEKVDQYIWAASRRGNRIRISGYVPTVVSRQAIIGVTRANFPGFEVVDRTRLARGVPSTDTWLTGVSFALKQLASLKRGDVRLDGLGLMVFGEAEDLMGYRAVKAALATELPKGIKLVKEEVTAPVVSPFTWSARWANKRLVMSGYVPSDAARAELQAAAKAIAPGAVDEMEPADGPPQGWASAAVASVRGLGGLQSGAAEMKDGVLIISGTAANDTDAESIRAGLRAAMPSTIKLIDQIQISQPPPKPSDAPAPQVSPKAASEPKPDTPDKVDAPAPDAPKAAPKSGNGPANEAPAAERQAAAPQAAPAPQKPQDPPAAIGGSVPERQQPAPPEPAPSVPKADGSNAPKQEAPVAGPERLAGTPKTEGAPRAAEEPPPPGKSSAAPKTEPSAPKSDAAPQQQAMAPTRADPVQAAVAVCREDLARLAQADRIRFRIGRAELDSGAAEILDKVAAAAKSCPAARIEIGGHASAEGSAYLNRRLSIRRAQAVLAYLVLAGVDADQLSSVGYGATQPAVPNDSKENMAKNRRIEFTVRQK